MIRQGVTLIATAVLGAGLLAGCGSSGESAEAPAEEGKTEVGTGSVGGDPVFDGDVGFQVTTVNKLPKELPAVVQQAIDDSDEYELPDGAAVWTSDVKVTNNGTKSVAPVCSSSVIAAIDQKDREYDMASSIDIMSATQTGKSMFCTTVQPGFSKTGTVYFATPDDSTIESFRLYNSSEPDDALGDTYVVIKR